MSSLAGIRFLLVENEALIRMSLCDTVEELGATVVDEAGTYDAAMEKARSSDFDIAILDVNLSGKMSFDIGRELKRRGRPFIFATGYREDDVVAGFGVPVVIKPFTKEAIEMASRRALSA